MFKRIREYFALQKLYRDSKKVLVINMASTITSVKSIIEKVEQYVDAQNETIGSLSKDELDNMVKFMTEMTNNKDMHKTAVQEIIKGIKTEK